MPFLRDRIGLRLVQLEILPPRMGEATELGHALAKDGLIPAEVINHQRSLPVRQEIARVHTRSTGLVVKDHNRRSGLQSIAHVRPEVSSFGLAVAGVQLLHGCFIGMQDRSFQQQHRQTVGQGLQRDADAAHPFGQGGTRQGHTIPRRDAFQAVQGEMVQVLTDDHPGQKSGRRHATVDHRRRNRCRRYGFTGTARILRTNVAMNEELRRLDVELLTDVFADEHQVLAALAAGTGLRFMAMLDARQMLGKGLPASALAFGTGSRRRAFAFGLALRQFNFGGGDVAGQGLLKQVPNLLAECFALDAKAHPPQVRQFQRQGLDLGAGSMEFRVTPGDLFGSVLPRIVEQLAHRLRRAIRQGRIGDQAFKFNVQVHVVILLACIP
jgi:hypothetical protein